MKKLIFCILIGMFALSSMFAQRSEIGGLVGGSFYLGDLNPTGVFSQTQLAAGVIYRYNLNTRWTIRGNALWGTVKADDEKHNNEFQQNRNLSFRSRINEFSIQTEINFLPYFTGSRTRYRFSPYLFGGVGLFTFNPQAYRWDPYKNKGEWLDLARLSTEGQGLAEYPDKKFYNTTQICFPFGLGFKYSLNSIFAVGLEWGMRFTLTDYLDDVSGNYINREVLAREQGSVALELADRSKNGPQPEGSRRGSSNKTDWYSFAGVTLTAKIGTPNRASCPAHKQSGADRVRRSMGEL
ncbi:MAG: DUF6089 family protein [Bacteroidales bacterium]|nr:DUF6089 family protein [Bacteroidales bacterium]